MPLRPRHSARAHRGALWRHWTLWIYFPVALLLVMGGAFLWRSGHWLVAEDPFGKVRWAVVLAGEGRDAERSEAALKLYLEGRIDTLIYSATRTMKDRYASEFMKDWLVRQGYPADKIFEFRQDAYSTQEEAALLIRQFRWQNLDTVLIITANFHAARTRRIFRKLSQGYPHVLVYPAELRDFEPGAWWSSREGAKHWLMEWAKTLSTWIELTGSPAETGKSETNGLIGGNYGTEPQALPEPVSVPDAAPAPPADSSRDSAKVAQDTASPDPAVADSARSGAPDTAKADEPLAAREAQEPPEVKEPAKEPPKAPTKAAAKETAPAKAKPVPKADVERKPAVKKPSPKEKAVEKEKPRKKPAK